MDYRSQIKEKMGKLLFLEMNIKGFKEIAADFKHLKLEDSVKKSDTGYEFDI